MLIIKNFFYLFFLNFLSLFSDNDSIVEKNIIQVSNIKADTSHEGIKTEANDSLEETQLVPDDEVDDDEIEELIETGDGFDLTSMHDLNNLNLEVELDNLNSDDDLLSDNEEDEEIEEYEEEIE